VEVANWKGMTMEKIEDLQPWEPATTEAPSPSQTPIRESLESVRETTTDFNNPPAPGGHPMQEQKISITKDIKKTCPEAAHQTTRKLNQKKGTH